MGFLLQNTKQELAAAEARLAIALANPDDDRYNLAKERSAVAWLKDPSFCTGSTEDEIRRAKEGDESVFVYDIARQVDAKDPWQCETSRLYDLRTNRWYRESPLSLLKNIGAGVINSIVPGSDLGNADSSTQILGQGIGGFASLFVNPSAILQKASMGLGTTIGNAFNFVNKAFSGPIGSIATGYIGSLVNPRPVPAQAMTQVLESARPANLNDQAMSFAQKAVFGGNVGGTSVQIGQKPWYQNPLYWGIGAVVLLAGFFLFKKRKR